MAKLLSHNQQSWLTANNKTYPIICKMCTNPVKWYSSYKRFGIYCSVNCASLDTKTQRAKSKITCLEKYGVDNPSKHPDVKEVQRDTNLERYGCHPRKLKQTKQKQKETCLIKYGVDNPQKNLEVQAKTIQTNLNKFGGVSPLCNDVIREKIKQTCITKFGTIHHWTNLTVRTKIAQTNLDKYGVEYHSQQHMIDILPLIQDYSWLFNQYIIQDKTAIQIANELGIDGTTILNYLRAHEIEIKQGFWISYKSQLWLNQQEGIIIIPEYKIPGTRLRADGYCAATNTIYEFHGDYWHGNPEIYPSDFINEVTGLTMGELYQNTIEREHLIKSLGYNLAVIWEYNFNFEKG